MLLSELGQRIRAQRERLRLKQHDIAHALQVSPQAVSKWERGENGPDLTILGELARLLGVSTDWLLDTHSEGRNVFTASVLTSTVVGAYEKSLHMAPRDFAIWANGCFLQLTESALGHDGVPVCYMGDAFLCFFSGTEHRQRAVRTAFLAKRLIADPLLIGLSSPPLLFKPAISRPWRPETPEALSQPILSGVPRARKAVPRLATSRFRRQERRAGEAADTASRQRLPAEAGQRRAVQLGAKKWLSFTYTSPPIRH
jgi:transcriptional regulator with XRE-family HTH domain